MKRLLGFRVSKEILDKVHAEVKFPYTPEQIKKASRHVPDENVQNVLSGIQTDDDQSG